MSSLFRNTVLIALEFRLEVGGTRMRGITAILAVVLVSLPAVGRGDATTGIYNWCVQGSPGTDAETCFSAGCDAPVFTDIASAVSAAEATPDLSDGTRPDHVICVRGNDPVIEDVVIDNTTGVFGSSMVIDFEPGNYPTYCPPASSPNPFGISMQGPPGNNLTALRISNLRFDGATCPGATRDLISVVDIDLTVTLASVEANAGVVLSGSGGVWQIQNSRFQAGTEPLIAASGATIVLEGVEVSNYDLTGASLIDNGSFGGGVSASSSAVFGNVVRGDVPLVRTGGAYRLHHSMVAGNVVLGAPLVALTMAGSQRVLRLEKSVVSRNRLLRSSTSVQAAPAASMPDVGLSIPGDLCFPFASTAVPFLGRDLPDAQGTAFDGPLFALSGDSQSTRRLALLVSNFFVENELGGGGALLELSGPMADLDVFLIHNTVDAMGVPLVRDDGQGSGTSLSTARNLIVGESSLALAGGLDHAESSLDWLDDSGTVFTDDLTDLTGLLGPSSALRDAGLPVFLPESETSTWSHCTRVLANCPNQTDCSSIPDQGLDLACALDAAIRYMPNPALDGLISTWPWESGWFGDHRTAAAGATGIACGGHAPPFDRVLDPVPTGDGDTFTTLVDCDNEDPDIKPRLPEYDGYSSPYCDPDADDDCYTCPEGSQWPPPDDDDDAIDDDDAVDDDDSGPPVDDDDSGPPVDDDDDSTTTEIRESCTTSGCGVSYSCRDGKIVFLPMLLIPLRRRRSGRDQ
jgi:hypothetical protein